MSAWECRQTFGLLHYRFLTLRPPYIPIKNINAWNPRPAKHSCQIHAASAAAAAAEKRNQSLVASFAVAVVVVVVAVVVVVVVVVLELMMLTAAPAPDLPACCPPTTAGPSPSAGRSALRTRCPAAETLPLWSRRPPADRSLRLLSLWLVLMLLGCCCYYRCWWGCSCR